MRTRSLLGVLSLLLALSPAAWSQPKADALVSDFKAQPLYRAADLTWKVRASGAERLTFQIVRADTFADGPYTEVALVQSTPGKTAYEYVDRSVGAESRYHYKLIVKETGETLGPISTRPYFSPPAT